MSPHSSVEGLRCSASTRPGSLLRKNDKLSYCNSFNGNLLQSRRQRLHVSAAYKMVEVTLKRPLGMILAENEKENTVFVEEIAVGGNAEKSGQVSVGDVLSKQGSLFFSTCYLTYLLQQGWFVMFKLRLRASWHVINYRFRWLSVCKEGVVWCNLRGAMMCNQTLWLTKNAREM